MDRTGMSAGVVAAVDHLRELAGPRLYLRNPFRLTGLPTDVNRRVVRAARQRVESGGVPAPASGELTVPATEAELVAALEELGDPGRRIVGEVFWLWGTDKPRCGCTGEFHAEHDEAVRAHALALDLEAEPEEREVADALWLAAAKLWSELLRRAEFWEHLRHRVADLEDDGLDQTVLAALHAELPRALVMPLAVLAAGSDRPERLVAHARRWEVGASVLDEALAEAAGPGAAAPEAGEDSGQPASDPEATEEPSSAREPEPADEPQPAGEPQPADEPEPAEEPERSGEPEPPVLPRQRGTEPADVSYEAPAPEPRPVAYPPAESFPDAAYQRERYQPETYHVEQFPTDVFATPDFSQPARRQRSGDMKGFYLALLTAAILIAIVILVLV